MRANPILDSCPVAGTNFSPPGTLNRDMERGGGYKRPLFQGPFRIRQKGKSRTSPIETLHPLKWQSHMNSLIFWPWASSLRFSTHSILAPTTLPIRSPRQCPLGPSNSGKRSVSPPLLNFSEPSSLVPALQVQLKTTSVRPSLCRESDF